MSKVLSWNTQRQKGPIDEALQNQVYDVVCIQEPPKTPYNPYKGQYWLIQGGAESKTAIYINKRHPRHSYDFSILSDFIIQLRFYDSYIFNLYSPISRGREDIRISPFETLLQQPRPSLLVLLLRDTNLFHPLWDSFGRTSKKAYLLLDLATAWGLDLLTPRGTLTRIGLPGERDSTIDHIWASPRLAAYSPEQPTLIGSDHRPQLCTFLTAPPLPVRLARSWKGANTKDIECLALEFLSFSLSDMDDLDRFTNKLICALQDIADIVAPEKPIKLGQRTLWWNPSLSLLRQDTKRAFRVYKAIKTPATYEAAQANLRAYSKGCRRAKGQLWRTTLTNAEPAAIWKLGKWAKREPTTYSLPKLPALQGNGTSFEITFQGKSDLLSSRFFPALTIDPSVLPTPIETRVQLERITVTDIEAAIRTTKPWKAAGGYDKLPLGFLKACGPPLFSILSDLANRSMETGLWPAAFKHAEVIVLPKPGKSLSDLQQPKGYRPISLLSCLGKIIEKAISQKLLLAIEAADILPEEQMGFRPNRSTELAAKLVTELATTAQRLGGTSSLLQLDLSAAFDSVHHGLLLATLRSLGLAPGLVSWFESYLSSRTATLSFDDQRTAPFQL